MRGVAHVEEVRKDRPAIIVTELPFMVNKARWIETAADMVRDKKLEGISDIRDESDRTGIRVVFELKRDAQRSGRPREPVQVHGAAELVQRQHAGDRRRPARCC